MTPKIRLG